VPVQRVLRRDGSRPHRTGMPLIARGVLGRLSDWFRLHAVFTWRGCTAWPHIGRRQVGRLGLDFHAVRHRSQKLLDSMHAQAGDLSHVRGAVAGDRQAKHTGQGTGHAYDGGAHFSALAHGSALARPGAWIPQGRSRLLLQGHPLQVAQRSHCPIPLMQQSVHAAALEQRGFGSASAGRGPLPPCGQACGHPGE
jgi:hypothetical protein